MINKEYIYFRRTRSKLKSFAIAVLTMMIILAFVGTCTYAFAAHEDYQETVEVMK